MLKTRIIPTLLLKNGALVKDKNFLSLRRVGSVMTAVKIYNMRQVDELIMVDIDATKENIDPDYELIAESSRECFMPLTIGGGVRTIEHAKKIINSGADKVAVNSAIYYNPNLISEISQVFGSQSIVVSIDVKKELGRYICYSHCGQKRESHNLEDLLISVQKLGAGEILLTSIDNDGTMQGYDLDLIKIASNIISIPIIIQGGCKDYQNMYDAIKSGAHAISAASIFHFTQQTPLEAKEYLKEKGVFVRKIV